MAFVQCCTPGTIAGAGTVTTSSITTTTGNWLVCFSSTGASTVSTVSDSKSNTWTALSANPVITTTKGFRLYGFYAENIIGGSGHTFTLNLTPNEYACFLIAELSGRATSSSIDAQGTGFSDVTSVTSHTGASATSLTAGSDILSLNCNDLQGGATETFTAGSGWTIPTNGFYADSSVTTTGMLQYRANQSAGAYTGAFTTGNSTQAASVVLAVKAAAGGGIVVKQLGLLGVG